MKKTESCIDLKVDESPEGLDPPPCESNEQYCSEYVSGIYDYLRQRETLFLPDRNYLTKLQPDLTEGMREILMDWLVGVCEEAKVCLETLLLAKNYIDRYLSREQIRRGNLQLLGITALLVASKLEVNLFFFLTFPGSIGDKIGSVPDSNPLVGPHFR